MAKKPKTIDVPVRVVLNTDQLVDLSIAVERFVDILAEVARQVAVDLGEISQAAYDFRVALPLPTYRDDDEDIALPDCTTTGADCACNGACL